MLKLMNSAVMPHEGNYKMTQINLTQFVNELKAAPSFESYIGYPATARFIEAISEMKILLSREQTSLDNGDEMLIIKLKYRVQNPAEKGRFDPASDDYEFFHCHFSKWR